VRESLASTVLKLRSDRFAAMQTGANGAFGRRFPSLAAAHSANRVKRWGFCDSGSDRVDKIARNPECCALKIVRL
jgi:hypothetical protein